MKMMSPNSNMTIFVGETGHTYHSGADKIVVEDVQPVDLGVLTGQGYTRADVVRPIAALPPEDNRHEEAVEEVRHEE
jgi:hypothetical protein